MLTNVVDTHISTQCGFISSSGAQIISDTCSIDIEVLTLTRHEVFLECGAVETKRAGEGRAELSLSLALVTCEILFTSARSSVPCFVEIRA